MWRGLFAEVHAKSAATPKIGRMQIKAIAGEYRYAVAIRKNSDLWLTLWVKRNRKGEFFVMVPRADGELNAHASYHLSGRFHFKSYGRAGITKDIQPLTGKFIGAENLGQFAGHGTRGGAICDPADFTGFVEVPDGILGPAKGAVLVDLVEPSCSPHSLLGKIVREQTFKDTIPCVVIRVAE
jgi:hypothetical protein